MHIYFLLFLTFIVTTNYGMEKKELLFDPLIEQKIWYEASMTVMSYPEKSDSSIYKFYQEIQRKKNKGILMSYLMGASVWPLIKEMDCQAQLKAHADRSYEACIKEIATTQSSLNFNGNIFELNKHGLPENAFDVFLATLYLIKHASL